MSIDPFKVGQQQAAGAVEAMKAAGKTTPRDRHDQRLPHRLQLRPLQEGRRESTRQAGAKIVKSYDTPDWSPDKAQQEMEQTITSLGKTGFDAVYVANDGMAGGAIAAMKSAGMDPAKFFVTGQDAEVSGVQRILKGEQLNTVYQPLKEIAGKSAEIAVALAQGKPVPAGIAPEKVDNGAGQVPSALVPTLSVDKSNVNDTVIKDGFLTAADVCTARTPPPARTPASSEPPRAELPRKLSRRSPKGEQLRSILEDLIDALKPGDPLPSERELAERYDVARMTVRAEITRLASEGLVERVQGRGTFVAEARVAQAAALSSFTEDMRARGLKPGSEVLGQGTVPADDLVARRLGLEPGTRRGPRPPRAHRRRRADGAGGGFPARRPLRRHGGEDLGARRCSPSWRTASARASRSPTSRSSRARSSARTPTCCASRPAAPA